MKNKMQQEIIKGAKELANQFTKEYNSQEPMFLFDIDKKCRQLLSKISTYESLLENEVKGSKAK